MDLLLVLKRNDILHLYCVGHVCIGRAVVGFSKPHMLCVFLNAAQKSLSWAVTQSSPCLVSLSTELRQSP